MSYILRYAATIRGALTFTGNMTTGILEAHSARANKRTASPAAVSTAAVKPGSDE